MKLKRFLLRYEPPGIGLEVEEVSAAGQSSCQVVHKDLPHGSSVTTSKDIHQVVDSLIAEESILLTKRRHRPALIQLLGRLYQVEVEPTDDEGDATNRPAERGATQAAASTREESPGDGGIQEGQQVVLIGLKGKQQVHNGELATVLKAREEKQKYEVMLVDRKANPDGEALKVKGVEHMVPTAPKGTGLAVGTHVAIRGLRNHIELNGCLGRVVECHEESHRFEVRATESGQLFRVKQENLIPIEAIPAVIGASKENREPNTSPRLDKKGAGGGASSSAPGGGLGDNTCPPLGGEAEGDVFELGSTVQLFGLKTAMNYNGQSAEVLSVDRARCRYEIRLGDGSVKTIRAENVRLISGPSKTTPRTRRAKDAAGKPKA